jgi:hypothetical protein
VLKACVVEENWISRKVVESEGLKFVGQQLHPRRGLENVFELHLVNLGALCSTTCSSATFNLSSAVFQGVILSIHDKCEAVTKSSKYSLKSLLEIFF